MRFFIVPSPAKRTTQQKDGTKLDQVLYESIHTKDAFLFFRGKEPEEETSDETSLQIAFLKLAWTKDDEEMLEEGKEHHIQRHCNYFAKIKEESILGHFINDFEKTAFEDQMLLPDPTIIKGGE